MSEEFFGNWITEFLNNRFPRSLLNTPFSLRHFHSSLSVNDTINQLSTYNEQIFPKQRETIYCNIGLVERMRRNLKLLCLLLSAHFLSYCVVSIGTQRYALCKLQRCSFSLLSLLFIKISIKTGAFTLQKKFPKIFSRIPFDEK